MAEDTEVLREVWNGRVPVCFRLDPHELSTIEEPEPYFVSKSLQRAKGVAKT